MKTIQRVVLGAVAAIAVIGSAGCSDMTRRQQDTAVGAGAGAVVGGVLTGGSALGVVGGAAVGGLIGNEVGRGR